MRKLLLLMIAVFFSQAVYADPIPPRLMRSLKGVKVMKATLRHGTLQLTTNLQTLEQDAYITVIDKGNCAVLLADSEKGWLKARIDRIEVWNKSEREGYAFIRARASCMALEEIMEEGKRKAHIMEKTVSCTATGCAYPPPSAADTADDEEDGDEDDSE